jgi:D-alanyl-D-alanine endopeptidase (penicillin-binding protein 7)
LEKQILIFYIKNQPETMRNDIKLALVAVAVVFTLVAAIFPGARSSVSPADDAAPAPDAASTPAAPAVEAPPAITASDIIRYGNPDQLSLRSSVALIMDAREGVVLYGHHIDDQRPIASLTKLMTAMVILNANLPLDEDIEITRADRDTLRGTRSRLQYGAIFTRYDLLRAALGASDNRAAAALGRTYPGGTEAMVKAMNDTALALGMQHTYYADTSGLDSANVSTAQDLVRLVNATTKHPLFHTFTTSAAFAITEQRTSAQIRFNNTNRLVRSESWDIGLSKTGYTADAGHCLVMQATINSRPVTIVLLNSWGKYSRLGDSNRIRDWLQKTERKVLRINNGVVTRQS